MIPPVPSPESDEHGYDHKLESRGEGLSYVVIDRPLGEKG